MPRRYLWIALISMVVVVVVGVIVVLAVALPLNGGNDVAVDNDSSSTATGFCPAKDFPLQYHGFYKSDTTVTYAAEETVVIHNATVWTGVQGSTFLSNYDIVIVNGKITQIGQNLVNTVTGATVYDVKGNYVTPGLVDTHSHLGVYSYPEDAWATQDGNELTNPVLPQLRAIDGLNPNDPAIPLIRVGGVTTSLVLPGSGNVQGGQAAVVKLRGDTVSKMLMEGAPRALKMACGENPKRVYGNRGQTPESRLGVGWMFRSQFYKAAQLKQAQQQWDCLNQQGKTTEPRPNDISLEPLVGLLNGDVLLHVHCYKVEDLEMIIRTANEFGIRVATFQHALEAWKVPDLMRDNNITICTFADHWGFKMEGYDASVNASKVLVDAGAQVALKSDHPVIFARYLIHEPAKAHFYGLDEYHALASVTIVPARGMGVSNRVGSLEVGKDGDVVVWDRYPLQLGAKANKVFIDGQLIDDYGLPTVQRPSNQQATLAYTGPTACKNTNSNLYVVQGVNIFTMNDTKAILTNSILVVENGLITCMSSDCDVPANADVYTLNGGVVLPGTISVGMPIGLVEVESEAESMDGTAQVIDGHDIRAIDGIRFNSFHNRHMRATWAGGVTTVVTGPQGSSLVSGVSVAFHSRGNTVDDALISDAASLDLHIGNHAKQGQMTSSVSGQFAYLRSLFKSANGTGNTLDQVLTGTLPLIVFVQQADEIAALVRLKKELGIKPIIVGGAEAHLVANLLATNNIPVILARMAPSTYETWRAVPNSAALLQQAGVTVGITQTDLGNVRNLRWEAGLQVSEGLPYYDGLASITRVPAELLGLDIAKGVGQLAVGAPANFVAYSSDPLSFDGSIQLIGLGAFVECQPHQY